MSGWGGFGNCALIIAHPGHELQMFGWLKATKPTVYVLTDGSGRAGVSRLASTRRLLAKVGARPGAIFGAYRDRVIYDAILRRDVEFFRQRVSELADALTSEASEFVLSDAADGTILTHDVWHAVGQAAIGAAEERPERVIPHFEFAVEGPGDAPARPRAQRLRLDDQTLQRKVAAARGYTELRREVDELLGRWGEEAFRTETLWPTGPATSRPHLPKRYERHGEALAAAGVYPAAVRYEEHVMPILEELQRMRRAA
jgi:hypothetical protein